MRNYFGIMIYERLLIWLTDFVYNKRHLVVSTFMKSLGGVIGSIV